VEKAEGYIVDFSFLGGLGSQKFAHRVNVGLLASNKEDDRVRSAIYSTARRPFWIYYYMLSFVYLFQFSSVYCVVYIQYTQDDDRHVYLFFIFIIPIWPLHLSWAPHDRFSVTFWALLFIIRREYFTPGFLCTY
jgi:hypothetical protein